MKNKFFSLIICFLLIFSFASCSDKDTASSSDAMVEELGLTADSKEASETTVEINSALYDLLDFEDDSEYQNAVKGLIDAPEALEISSLSSKISWIFSL